ncbi:SDR family oxidoreductase [Clostridium sp. CS001]|uniref:SDR family NAD(P)-dependent oxidoreductase n=1 Tax=Clostridium sp. CS001 TaxID=2880648 RepID=UPI001CF42B1A|nr:SDR family NAD(P)-dependent oxidoreductase [Clostridium sp. CS001]MCB2289870.1 SDR family oxidoreductase [Clostridium sp. CS001]
MLKDKVAIITGGTRGIGYAIVKKYLENGAKVILFGSKQETADKAVESLKAENSKWTVEGMAPKLTDANDLAEAIKEIAKKYGRIDILVNNAGISQATSIYEYKPGEFDEIMNINVKAIFNAIQPTVSVMKEQGGGCIINTSSMVSISGQKGGVGYPTSKYAVNGMTQSLARELGPDNIRVNAVAPGVIQTDMVDALSDELKAYIMGTIPLHRIGTPDDVANAFLYLASDMADYVTGEILSVDGAARV